MLSFLSSKLLIYFIVCDKTIGRLAIHDAEDMLGLPKDLSAKQLYSNLNWLENNQLSIEKKLQKIHKVKANLYLYDVTSSYLEGANN